MERGRESSVVVLETPKGKVNALIQEVQIDPIRGIPTHVDFYIIEKVMKLKLISLLSLLGLRRLKVLRYSH